MSKIISMHAEYRNRRRRKAQTNARQQTTDRHRQERANSRATETRHKDKPASQRAPCISPLSSPTGALLPVAKEEICVSTTDKKAGARQGGPRSDRTLHKKTTRKTQTQTQTQTRNRRFDKIWKINLRCSIFDHKFALLLFGYSMFCF